MMSWGKKILILYLGFVTLILTLVFTCFGNKTELEYKDYYTRELRFQDQINARDNASRLADPIAHKAEGMQLSIQLPTSLLTSDLKGTIELMRPSDSSKDVNLAIDPDRDGNQVVTVNHKGPYRLRVNLISAGTEYFHEAIVRFR